MKTVLTAGFAMLAFGGSALAEDPPLPKMFQGMQGKGQYRVEVLEGPGRESARKAPRVTLCTENLMKPHSDSRRSGSPSCKYKVQKDTADEAVVESTCDNRTSVITVKRENAKSVLMSIDTTGARGESHMKVRYTHLGACREGQGTVSFDKDSDECRKLREQAAKMDPAKQCANARSDREACEERTREARERLLAMCS